MKGKMYRLTGTGLFGKHSNGRFGANDIPRPKRGGKTPPLPKSKAAVPQGKLHPDKPEKS
jgi:hypothetical protein